MIPTIDVHPEYNRLKTLNDLYIDYNELQDEFKNLTALAASIAGTEVSFINLIDNYTQWTVSHHGEKLSQLPREDAVCNYTIREKESLEVPRLDLDERFRKKSYVAGNGGLDLKYYFGLPLSMKNGENIGALCVLDRNEKQLSPQKMEQLQLISVEIVRKLESRKELQETRKNIRDLKKNVLRLVHDIKGPLSGIIGISDLAISENLSVAESRSYFNMIQQSSDELNELSNDVLVGSRKDIIEFQDLIKIKELSRKIHNLYKPQAEFKKVELRILVDKEDEEMNIEKAPILQICGNLVSNAIKFTPVNGLVEVTFKLVTGEAGSKDLMINVQDSGIGLSTDKIKNIMEGEAISSVGSAGEIGYGLGLKLVQEMIKKVNGSLDITAKDNTGACFIVQIPLK